MALMHKNANKIVFMDEIMSKLAVLATENGRDHGEAHGRIWVLLSCWKSSIFGFPQVYVLADIFLALTS